MTSRDYQIFELGDVALQSGLTLRNAELAYKTYGRLDAARSNVIVYPTSYGAQHYDTEWLIRPGRALDPERYFIIIPNMFGNGLSSSPSNVGPPHDRGRFPGVTVADNVRMQHRLLREQLGIERVALVYGWSMAASRPITGRRSIPKWWSGSPSSAAARAPRRTTKCFSKASNTR